MSAHVKSKGSVLIVAICGSLLVLGAASFAQQTPKSQTDNQQTKIGDKELRSFVRAYVENQKIRQKYEPALQKSTDADRSRQIQDQANEELKRSLARQNLTVEEYNMIYQQVNSDEQLRSKTLKLVEEERKRASASSRQPN